MTNPRLMALWVVGLIAVAVGLSLPWLRLDGGNVVRTSGTPLFALSILLAALTLGALLASPAQRYATVGATLVWGFAMYSGIALLRALPTYAAVHFSSGGAAALGIPVTLLGASLLIVAAWAGLLIRPQGRHLVGRTHQSAL